MAGAWWGGVCACSSWAWCVGVVGNVAWPGVWSEVRRAQGSGEGPVSSWLEVPGLQAMPTPWASRCSAGKAPGLRRCPAVGTERQELGLVQQGSRTAKASSLPEHPAGVCPPSESSVQVRPRAMHSFRSGQWDPALADVRTVGALDSPPPSREAGRHRTGKCPLPTAEQEGLCPLPTVLVSRK